jgi:hypothetical protein
MSAKRTTRIYPQGASGIVSLRVLLSRREEERQHRLSASPERDAGCTLICRSWWPDGKPVVQMLWPRLCVTPGDALLPESTSDG